MRAIRKAGLLSLALLALSVLPAAADRAPTAEERTLIESALRAEGFTRWEEIELDDNHWEVDNAHAPDGKQYDVKLDPASMAIISRDVD